MLNVLGLGSMKLSKVVVADLQVMAAAFFFGIGFLGQRAISVHGMGPMTCNAFRFGLSTVLLVACLPLIPPDAVPDDSGALMHEKANSVDGHKMDRNGKEAESPSLALKKVLGPYSVKVMNWGTKWKKTIWFWGCLLGFINFCGSGFQQWGISLTSASKCAFIAGFDLFLTPVFASFIPTFKRNARPMPSTWLAVCISLVGLFLLSGLELEEITKGMGMGETLSIISTIFWTMHITYTDIATSYVDSVSMMCMQLAVVTVLSAFIAFLTEAPTTWSWEHITNFLPWLVFLAISEGLGFTLMAVGQNFSPPTHAAIILSLEGVFASVASYIFLGEHLSTKELIGCSLMLVSTLVAKIGCGQYESRLGFGSVDISDGHSHGHSHKNKSNGAIDTIKDDSIVPLLHETNIESAISMVTLGVGALSKDDKFV